MMAITRPRAREDGMTLANDPTRNEIFLRERPHLLVVAFRILGSDADAQDVVQEAWIRFAGADISEVRNMTAFLTTIVSRLCLDHLRHARFIAPEPPDEPSLPADEGDEPERIALLASELTEAWKIVLDELAPPQRVALILHDVFGVPFTEIARVLDTTPGAAKKIASRARGRLRERQPARDARADPGETRRVVSAFLRAVQHGDIASLMTLLDPDVTRTADAQLLPAGVPARIRGVEAVIHEASANRVRAGRSRLVTIDGQPGLATDADGAVIIAMVFRVARGRIVHIDVIADPHRLAQLHFDG